MSAPLPSPADAHGEVLGQPWNLRHLAALALAFWLFLAAGLSLYLVSPLPLAAWVLLAVAFLLAGIAWRGLRVACLAARARLTRARA